MKKIQAAVILMILVSFLIGIYFYPSMPELMASHWGYKGEVNGYLPKFLGLFLMPMLSLVIFFAFLLVPKIDPRKENIAKFGGYFDRFILLMEIFLFYLYILTVLWNLGMRFNMSAFMTPAMAGLFYYCGIMIENAKPNWFIGIRTPWTLSSENVWNRTHRLGGRLFKAAGLISLLGILAGDFAIFFVLVPIIAVSFYLVLFSYFEYKKEVNGGNKQ